MEKHSDRRPTLSLIRRRFSLLIALIHHFMEHYHRHDPASLVIDNVQRKNASTAGQLPPPIHLPSRQSQPLSDLSRSVASLQFFERDTIGEREEGRERAWTCEKTRGPLSYARENGFRRVFNREKCEKLGRHDAPRCATVSSFNEILHVYYSVCTRPSANLPPRDVAK